MARHWTGNKTLTHHLLVLYINASVHYVSIGSDNRLSPIKYQAII